MQVQLINKTPHYLRTIWAAGRTCHAQESTAELFANPQSESQMLKLVKYLMNAKHLSVMEHCSMTFSVSGVSRTLLAQYSRHRIGMSLSVQSQRYVSEKSSTSSNGVFDYVTPPTIDTPEKMTEYQKAMTDAQASYDRLTAMGVPLEDARFVLPGGICTNFATTLNLRSFLDIWDKRVLVKGAQWEVRQMLILMGQLLLEEEPWLEPFLTYESL